MLVILCIAGNDRRRPDRYRLSNAPLDGSPRYDNHDIEGQESHDITQSTQYKHVHHGSGEEALLSDDHEVVVKGLSRCSDDLECFVTAGGGDGGVGTGDGGDDTLDHAHGHKVRHSFDAESVRTYGGLFEDPLRQIDKLLYFDISINIISSSIVLVGINISINSV